MGLYIHKFVRFHQDKNERVCNSGRGSFNGQGKRPTYDKEEGLVSFGRGGGEKNRQRSAAKWRAKVHAK
jgi:hypothetical protein